MPPINKIYTGTYGTRRSESSSNEFSVDRLDTRPAHADGSVTAVTGWKAPAAEAH
jgi:hypothetical protein